MSLGIEKSIYSSNSDGGSLSTRSQPRHGAQRIEIDVATRSSRMPQGQGRVIDETPMAYKDIDAVMAAQSDLVEVVHTLRQVVCVKG
ncbi:MAG: RtcB family protein [Rhizomicrobium sp.]